MFEHLLKRLLAPAPTPLSAEEAHLALAALMVRIARADGDYSETEVLRIDRLLVQFYGLSPFAAARLRAEAEVLEAEAPDTVRFTRALKDAVPHEDRMELMCALWAVALADGARAAEEEALIRMVAPLLGISDRDSALARQRVERG
jgi:uncharacterized tellurite resistance protein B-like protein